MANPALAVPPARTLTLRVRIKGLRAEVLDKTIIDLVEHAVNVAGGWLAGSVTVTVPKPRKPRTYTESDEQFWQRMRTTYPHADLAVEERKWTEWLARHPGRKASREFVKNWLSRAHQRNVPVAPPPRPQVPRQAHILDELAAKERQAAAERAARRNGGV